MALQKFRDRQKVIYWIVALIVIPSFMIFGYSQVFDFNPDNSSIGKIDGREYTRQEFSDFYQRIQGVNFGQPIYFTLTGQTSAFSESSSMFLALALRDNAIKHGLIVTDEELATYIKAQFNYDGNNEKELEKLILNMLKQRTNMKSVFEYKVGVKDWLLIKKFLNLLDNSIFVPSALAELDNSMRETSYSYGRLEVKLADFIEKAISEIDSLSESDLNTKAKEFITNFQRPEYRRLYPFLWTEPQWEFEYIAVPLVVDSLEPEVTDKELSAFYNDNSNRYVDQEGKQQELADVKEQVKNDYIAGYRAQTAINSLGSEYDNFLQRLVLKGNSSDTVLQKVTLADISSDSHLANRGVTTGTTGDTPLTAFEIADNPVFTGSGIQRMLARLDYQFQEAEKVDKANGNNDATNKLFDDYSRIFHGFVLGDKEIPFSSSDKIITKIRLVKYIPGKTRKLGGSDNEDLLASIKESLIEKNADTMAEEAANAAIAELKENKRTIDGRDVTVEETSFDSITGKLKPLRTTTIGETLGPIVNNDGYNVYILYGKESSKKPVDQTGRVTAENVSTFLRGNSIYSPEFPMTPIIKIGARLASFISTEDKIKNFEFNGN